MALSIFDKALYSMMVYLFAILTQCKMIFYALNYFLLIFTIYLLIKKSKD